MGITSFTDSEEWRLMRFHAHLHNALISLLGWLQISWPLTHLKLNFFSVGWNKNQATFAILRLTLKQKNQQKHLKNKKKHWTWYFSMPGRPCGADFFNFCHAGLYPDVITRVKFPVDWPRVWSLRPIGLCGCLKLGALVLRVIPVIVAVTTVLCTTVIGPTLWPAVPSCKWIS